VKNAVSCLAIPLLVALVPSLLPAQSTAARVLGTVTDATGAVIPSVSVVATNPATGWKTTSTSNAEGQYVLFPMPPGVYRLDFKKEGLKAVRIEQLTLNASDEVVRNVKLEVGATAQTVTVSATANAAILNETPSTENTVTEDQVDTLPLNGRDYNQLVFLSAGATDYSVTGTNYDIGTVAVNGNRGYSNGYLVDGVSNDSSFQNNAAAPLSVGLIREFKVISGVAPAEYGQAGTSITVVTKSGTNDYHGSAYEYYRGDLLQTRNPFTTTTVLPPYYSHQFGGALGGPLRLPRYNGRNRTFFFTNYEGLRQSGGGTRVATVAPDVFWQGDFASILPRVQLKNPLAASAPFPDNVIPANLLDPTALKLRPLFPHPTLSGLANNSVHSVDTIARNNQFTVKGDQLLPGNQSLSARLTYNNSTGFSPGIMGTPGVGYVQPRHGENGMLAWTAPVNATTVNELRLGASVVVRYDIYFNADFPNSDTLGMQGTVPVSSNLVPPLPIIQFTGTDAFTQLSYWPANGLGANLSTLSNNIYSLSDVVSTARGRHQFKAGFDGRRTNLNWLYENNGNGSIAFNGANASRSTGYSFGDFLLGLPSSSQQTPLQAKVLYSATDYAFFVQDTWRVSSNLTLFLGLRNEVSFHPSEQYNRFAIFTPNLQGGGIVVACTDGTLPTSEFNPGVVSKLTNAQGNFNFPIACGSSLGYDPRTLVANQPWNPGPRVGLAWDPTGHGKWLLRSGYGIFYTRLQEQYLSLGVGQNPPFASVLSYSQTISSKGVPSITLVAPYPTTGTASVSPYGLERNLRLPSNQQWNLTVERSLGSNTVLSLGYVGNKGTHLFRDVNLNAQIVNPANGQIVRKYQATFGGSAVNYEQADGDSIYDALQVEVRRRFAHGLAFQSNWTWAKGLDDVGQAANAALLDSQNLGRDRANSDYVRRHQIASNFTWELPVGRGRRFGATFPAWLNAAAGGWRLSGICRWTTGRYLTPTFTNTGAFNVDNRPDVVYGISPNLSRGERTPRHWFNPAAFAVPPAVDPVTGLPRFGDAGRNIVIGPGLLNADASLSKTFAVKERKQLIVRMDVFNAMNHPNWANPDMNITNVNTVATINAINGNVRLAQFAAEFRF
jgi:hypothetical protein